MNINVLIILQKMISDIDDDDNGYIEVEEFIPLMTQVIHEDKYLEDEVMEIFMNFGNEKRLLTSDALITKLVIAGNGLLTSGKLDESNAKLSKTYNQSIKLLYRCCNCLNLILIYVFRRHQRHVGTSRKASR